MRGLLLFAGAAVLLPLLYAGYTNHIWEDYFITFRHSQNLCLGHGLVFYPGERVHGFTSPLGTLLPALCYLATGVGSYLPAVWLFRVLSAAAFAGGGVFFLLAMRVGGSGRLTALAFALLYLLEAKSVAFSMNGMETGFMLLFLGWAFYSWARGVAVSWPSLGLAWAGLMWTRPDGCVYIAALGVAALAFAGGPRRPVLLALLKAAAVCAFLYLPWFVGAWLYYGSPVPNTIRAKSALGTGYPGLVETVTLTLNRFPERAAAVFRPVYFHTGGWPVWLAGVTIGIGAICAVCWLVPTRDRLGRGASLCFALVALYLSFLTMAYPWYLPPAAALGLFALVRMPAALGAAWPGGGRLPVRAFAGVVVGLLALEGWLFVMTTRQMAIQETEIETGNRTRVGLWLKDHVKDGERVYLECLGYIGYFSEARMLDYPGLVSPDVVREARREPRDMASVGLRLKPEWMVLRPWEKAEMARHREFAEQYALVEEFDVTDRIKHYGSVAGDGYLLYDARFEVYKRRPGRDAGPDSVAP
jgi:hypothetical protein